MTTGSRVLIVDDDRDTRDMYAWSLEARGFDVVCAGSAGEGFALAQDHVPDALVTDFTLPGEDGLALASRVRASAALGEVPLLLVSGRAFIGETGDRAMRLFDRILLKPVLPDDLIGEIVPLMLERRTSMLRRQLRDVRARVDGIPTGSAAGRVMSAVVDVVGVSAPAALLADSAAHYIGANDAACVLTGRSREELLSLRVWDLTPEISVPQGKAQWAQFVSAGSLSGAYRLNGPSGTAVDTCFAAFAHVLPDCHLSLLTRLPAGLIETAIR